MWYIHFIYGMWSNSPIPNQYIEHINLWKKNLEPEFKICIWRPPEIEEFLGEYPQWNQLIQQYQHPAQKCDVLRLLILYVYGGIYADLDTFPTDFFKKDNTKTLILDKINHGYCLVGIEHPYRLLQKEKEYHIEDLRKNRLRRTGSLLPKIRKGIPETLPRISNYWIASSKNHSFIRCVLQEAVARKHNPIECDYDILFTTGPDVISDAFRQTMDSDYLIYSFEFELFTRMIHHTTHGSWRNFNKYKSRHIL